MIAIVVAVLTIGTFIAELWLGMVVTGFTKDDMVIERAKRPAQYWAIMALHALIAFGLPILAFAAGI